VAVCAAIPCDHCGVGLDLSKSGLDSGQYAGLFRQTLSTQFIMFFFVHPCSSIKEIS